MTTVVLIARSAIAAGARDEMDRLAGSLAAMSAIDARVAFTEQGEPALRDVLLALRAESVASAVLLPLLIPMEPGFPTWLARAVARWRAEHQGAWPELHLAPAPGGDDLTSVLAPLIARASPLVEPARATPEGSVVAEARRRVLICLGGPCNNEGAALLWGAMRNKQKSEKLAAEGISSAKASCLGPCGLAPVVQVYPEGTIYGGIDEAALARIVAEHARGGSPVEEFAYAPGKEKQRLRSRPIKPI